MTVRILVGEALATLKTLPDNSVDEIVSSPPYFGLRDYQTAVWEGGDPDCKHKRVGTRRALQANSFKGPANTGIHGAERALGTKELGGVCAKCGASYTDHQIGLEETPEEYIEKLVAVFHEARRVLKPEGVCFVNIADSYAGSWGAQSRREVPANSNKSGQQINNHPKRAASTGAIATPGLKPKDLIGIPWMLAFAMRADGWFLRQEIIWAKPNPMPESVDDRCTKAHESVFMFTKSRHYYFDAAAIAEESIYQPANDPKGLHRGSPFDEGKTAEHQLGRASDRPRRSSRTKYELSKNRKRDGDGAAASFRAITETRNRRSVWTIATEPSDVPHYAMMPSRLAYDCIVAGCPPGGTVLDPFAGAGTTGLVASGNGRSAILIELGRQHAETAKFRIGVFATLESVDAVR